jgi:phosphate transport system protein
MGISPMSSTHSTGALERQLRDIRQRLLFMMDLAEGMLWSAVLALVTRDMELARGVADNNLELERGERELDAMCLDLLTAHGHAGRAERLPARALKMCVDIQHMGEIAVSVSHVAIELAGQPPLYNYDDLLTLAGMVHGTMFDVRAAFAESDVARAEAVIERRHEVGALYGEVFAHLVDRMRHDGRDVARAVRLQRTAWALARVADHTMSLAANVLELVHGRHVSRVSSLPPLKTSSATE